MINDLRVCFVGDSFVAGVGDPDQRGWVGRVAGDTHRSGQPLTSYNLGVRRDTTQDVAACWQQECRRRLPAGSDARLVLCVGVNDTTRESGQRRVAAEDSLANVAAIFAGAASAGWPVLQVGPPPVQDPTQNERIAQLDSAFSALCQQNFVPYVTVFDPLHNNGRWMREVANGDGSHPGNAGYQQFAELVRPAWTAWLRGTSDGAAA